MNARCWWTTTTTVASRVGQWCGSTGAPSAPLCWAAVTAAVAAGTSLACDNTVTGTSTTSNSSRLFHHATVTACETLSTAPSTTKIPKANLKKRVSAYVRTRMAALSLFLSS